MPRPWISANLAISVDGKITCTYHRPSGWTSKADHARLLELRKNTHALIVGRGTMDTDRMTLTVPDQAYQPLRCIVSRSGGLAHDHPIFQRPGGPIHLLITDFPSENIPAGVILHRSTLADFLSTLRRDHGVETLHCEGGGSLIRSLAEIDALDELHLTIAGHTLFGGHASPTVTGIPAAYLPATRALQLSHFAPQPETGECFLSYRRESA